MATFSVLAMVKPSPAELGAFIERHLADGAAQVLVYNDGPIDTLVAAGYDPAALRPRGVELIALDADFWRDEPDGRPADFGRRRIRVHTLGLRRCTSDWVFICDEDEFLLPETPIAAALDLIPDGVDSVVIPMAEAVWGPGDDRSLAYGCSWYRRPYPQDDVWEADRRRLYGPLHFLFRRGALGHTRGKQFVRTRAQFDEVDTHRCYRGGQDVSMAAETLGGPISRIQLLHYDAIGFDRWVRKFRSRETDPSMNHQVRPARRRQIKLLLWMIKLGRLPARFFFGRLYGLSPRQRRLLEARGLVFQRPRFIPVSDARRAPGIVRD